MRFLIIAILVFGIGIVSGCASAGKLTCEGKTYRLNRSAFEKEPDGRYRISAWRLDRGLLELGESPAGIQMVLPAETASGTSYEIAKDCFFWVRGYWYLVAYLGDTLWEGANSGTVHIQVWEPDRKTVEGTFEAQTPKGPVSGKLQVRPNTQDE